MGTLNGMFGSVYNRPVLYSVDQDLKTVDSVWGWNDWNTRNGSKITNHGTDVVGFVHPLTFKKMQECITRIKETDMGYSDTEAGELKIATPLDREIQNRSHEVRQLRQQISRSKEELRIALALLSTVRKLKGDK